MRTLCLCPAGKEVFWNFVGRVLMSLCPAGKQVFGDFVRRVLTSLCPAGKQVFRISSEEFTLTGAVILPVE